MHCTARSLWLGTVAETRQENIQKIFSSFDKSQSITLQFDLMNDFSNWNLLFTHFFMFFLLKHFKLICGLLQKVYGLNWFLQITWIFSIELVMLLLWVVFCPGVMISCESVGQFVSFPSTRLNLIYFDFTRTVLLPTFYSL